MIAKRKKASSSAAPAPFVELAHAIASGKGPRVLQLLKTHPDLVTTRSPVGTTGDGHYLDQVHHYLYAGDTALHVAAASYDARLVRRLIALGADCAAKNRRGAEPLHYACDTQRDQPRRQAEAIRALCTAGADPNALDKSGVSPLHRAVRTRGDAAVAALLELGADPRLCNASGSTPLHLAAQNTGRGGTGSPGALERQRRIIDELLRAGADPRATDARGRTAAGAATSPWVRELIRRRPAR
jgi:hypothetical protein